MRDADLDRALRDVARACEIDAHPEHVTTLALVHEGRGDTAAARHAHDRAVAAIAIVAPPPDHDGYDVDPHSRERPREHDHDVRASWPRRAARTLECRGAFRATEGDVTGAIQDLRASVAMHATPSATRRLARLGA